MTAEGWTQCLVSKGGGKKRDWGKYRLGVQLNSYKTDKINL